MSVSRQVKKGQLNCPTYRLLFERAGGGELGTEGPASESLPLPVSPNFMIAAVF